MEERAARIGPVLLVALLAASLAAGILVSRARTPDLALELLEYERRVEPGAEVVRIGFFVRFDEPDATIEIVGTERALARTLADGIGLTAEEPITCLWDGRDDEGDFVPAGHYRLRVTLPGQDREMVFPRYFGVPPRSEIDREDPVAPVSDPCPVTGEEEAG